MGDSKFYIKRKIYENNENELIDYLKSSLSSEKTHLCLKQPTKPSQLKKIFSVLPPTISKVSVFFYDRANYEDTDIESSLFSTLPKHIKSINLSGLEDLNHDKLIKLLKSIPPHVTGLKLKHYKLGKRSIEEIKETFKELPPSLISLSLLGNHLNRWKNQSTALSSLPGTLKSLDIGSNDLGEHTELLSKILSELPSSITSLDLKNNELFRVNLAECFAKIKVKLTHLNLCDNGLYGKNFVNGLKSLPITLAELNITHNEFYTQSHPTHTNLDDLFAALPKELHTLIMGWRMSWQMNFERPISEILGNSFSFLPGKVTKIDLSSSRLLDESEDSVKSVLSQIPKNVTTLDLSFGYLTSFSVVPVHVNTIIFRHPPPQSASCLAQLFSTTPAHVTVLDLTDNQLGSYTNEEFKLIIQAIPPHVKTVNLSKNGLFLNKTIPEINHRLISLGDNRARYILAGNGESDLTRALTPMVDLKNKNQLPDEVAAHILSFIDESTSSKTNSTYVNLLQEKQAQIKAIEEQRNNTEKNKIIYPAQRAIDDYLRWSHGETEARGPNRFFTRLRHGAKGREKAEELRAKLESPSSSKDEIIGIINDFLHAPQTRYHNHSLASFLLDKVKKIEGSPWQDLSQHPKYKPYN